MKVFDLNFCVDHYYTKHSTIVEKTTFNNRTFYAKFKRTDEPLTPLVLEQHLTREYTIAVPLLSNYNTTNYLVIEYHAAQYKRFTHLVKHLFKSLGITQYTLYEGKDNQRIQVFISVDNLPLDQADKQLQSISDALKLKMTKNWKYLPKLSLPNNYNIVTLPYKKI